VHGLGQHVRGVRSEVAAAGVQVLDRGKEFRAGAVLEQEAGGARPHHMQHVFLLGVHGQHEHACRGQLLGHAPHDFHAVQLRHRDVDHRDVGARALGLGQRADAVRGLGHDGALATAVQERDQPVAQQRVVVGHQDADRPHAGPRP
jgi:hypothetical protein